MNCSVLYSQSKILAMCSPTGNRTPASRVTGGDTDHYTIEDYLSLIRAQFNFNYVEIYANKFIARYRSSECW